MRGTHLTFRIHTTTKIVDTPTLTGEEEEEDGDDGFPAGRRVHPEPHGHTPRRVRRRVACAERPDRTFRDGSSRSRYWWCRSTVPTARLVGVWRLWVRDIRSSRLSRRRGRYGTPLLARKDPEPRRTVSTPGRRDPESAVTRATNNQSHPGPPPFGSTPTPPAQVSAATGFLSPRLRHWLRPLRNSATAIPSSGRRCTPRRSAD